MTQSAKLPTLKRCGWCGGDELYVQYHDEEWGMPVLDGAGLYERLILEGMQAGLSWITILRKRQRMHEQFFGFDMVRLAGSGEEQIREWLTDPGIIRHRGKLEAMVGNARLTIEHPDFAGWLWSFAPSTSRVHGSLASVPASTPESCAMSKALKKQGFKFVGPTICYAFMQSVGMVNDHVSACHRFLPCADLREKAVT